MVPPPFNEFHSSYVRTFITTGKRSILDVTSDAIAMHRDHTVMPIKLTVHQISGIGEDSIFMVRPAPLPAPPGGPATAHPWRCPAPARLKRLSRPLRSALVAGGPRPCARARRASSSRRRRGRTRRRPGCSPAAASPRWTPPSPTVRPRPSLPSGLSPEQAPPPPPPKGRRPDPLCLRGCAAPCAGRRVWLQAPGRDGQPAQQGAGGGRRHARPVSCLGVCGVHEPGRTEPALRATSSARTLNDALLPAAKCAWPGCGRARS